MTNISFVVKVPKGRLGQLSVRGRLWTKRSSVSTICKKTRPSKQCEFCIYNEKSFERSGFQSGSIGPGGPGGPDVTGGQGGLCVSDGQGGHSGQGGQGGQGGG